MAYILSGVDGVDQTGESPDAPRRDPIFFRQSSDGGERGSYNDLGSHDGTIGDGAGAVKAIWVSSGSPSVGDGGGGLLAHQPALGEAGEAEGFQEVRGPAGGDQLGDARAGDGAGLEAIGTPADVQDEALNALRRPPPPSPRPPTRCSPRPPPRHRASDQT